MTTETLDERAAQAHMIISLLDHWGVGEREKITLLGLPAETKLCSLQGFRHGKALPGNDEVLIRVEHILGISRALSLANPLNERAAVMWLHRRNHRLNSRTPLATMIDEGLDGIIRVRIQLDCSYGWYLDEQRVKAEASP
ncbi:MAG TPA: DUF2384 domain-containing protein [Gammaproteobacteria bacterium]|nr:DUF2384 domain-containing protein [Gammaproteobacteria bacterium]